MALIATILVEVGLMVFTGSVPGIFDWIVVLIFAGYIGYDWARSGKIGEEWVRR